MNNGKPVIYVSLETKGRLGAIVASRKLKSYNAAVELALNAWDEKHSNEATTPASLPAGEKAHDL